MAHAATLSGLAEGLVTATTGLTTDDRTFARLRDRTIKGLRDQSHARTNQFAIKATLDGLVEKFAVLNRDDLADGLESRLEELPTKSKWMPEILSLLLELSDRPAEKTVFADVENANKSPEAEPELTWEEIVADDPLDEPDIWESVDRGYHSSGDEQFDDESERTTSTTATSIEDQDPAVIARLHLIQPDARALDPIKTARNVWQEKVAFRQSLELSELTVVREMLSMLRGLTTDLFHKDENSGRITIAKEISLNGVSKSSLTDILESAIATGRALNSLRRWSSSSQQGVYQRSIQSSVHDLMSTFDKHLAELERRFAAPRIDTVVSIMDVLTDAQRAATSLMRLSLLTQLSSMSMGSTAPFALLDYLYDEVGIAQMAGDIPLLADLSAVLFAGLRLYLRPVSNWITTGTVSDGTDKSFFIRDIAPYGDPSELWHGRFELYRQFDGTPVAPKCITRFAQHMFALGKTKAFLSQLDASTNDHSSVCHDQARLPDFSTIQEMLRLDTLMPFSQLLSDCIESWLSNISVDCTPLLRSRLLDGCGLRRASDALPHVFFSKNGVHFENFAESLLDRIRNAKTRTSWNDQFLLTELAQTTLGAFSEVNSEDIYISMPEKEAISNMISIARKLQLVTIGYSFSWPIQNITGCQTSEPHSKVFVLLLQLHYAATLLRTRLFDLRTDRPAASAILGLRKTMLWFIMLLQDHVTTAAHTIHKGFSASLERAADVDAMVWTWTEYIKRLQTTLLLTEALEPVRNAIVEILELNEALAEVDRSEGVAILQRQYEKSLRFLIAGIRGVSRAGGEPMLEALAERLE